MRFQFTVLVSVPYTSVLPNTAQLRRRTWNDSRIKLRLTVDTSEITTPKQISYMLSLFRFRRAGYGQTGLDFADEVRDGSGVWGREGASQLRKRFFCYDMQFWHDLPHDEGSIRKKCGKINCLFAYGSLAY